VTRSAARRTPPFAPPRHKRPAGKPKRPRAPVIIPAIRPRIEPDGSVLLPIRLVSEANAHEHWRSRQRRAKAQRGTAAAVMRSLAPIPPAPPLRVTITRIAPRQLDSDNLAGSGKHLRDGIADWLGIKDNHPGVEWCYAQEKGKPMEYAARVLVERP
jgi:hypothetical protein